ncbi:hypothetical protein QE408_003730 [Agrobacterium larrymoorei]|uniref:Uncharacterized protein n=1 Tax=Agrobacterium larrymoorei TaxID=160699 RepID=A0ABU0UNP8_9HYPH|nr:hypothetical protein [Agrobacterium larrymoorei]
MAVWGACSQTRVTSAIFRVKICCFTQRRFISRQPLAVGFQAEWIAFSTRQ